MSDIQTLRPGLLVSVHTPIKGNISYRSLVLDPAKVDTDGAERKRWESTRTIVDPAEWDEAVQVRAAARALIVKVCTQSAFGLLCPEDDGPELIAAIAAARKLGDEFNARATVTRININVIYGRVAQDDVEAVRAITAEVRELMTDMEQGLTQLDVKAVREAASKAKALGEMLTPEASARVQVAIDAARSAARKIVKAGAEVGIEIDKQAIAQIDMARTSFLDLDGGTSVEAPEVEGLAIDLDPSVAEAVEEYTSTAIPQLEV